MKKLLIFVCLAFSCNHNVDAQSFDSNLPIVIINMDANAAIEDEPKKPGIMKIIYRGLGQRNFTTDQTNPAFLNYDGKIEIEIRGSSSQTLAKKQYSFTTVLSDNVSNNNVSLLGMPQENDWILNGLAFDPSLIRDYISYNLSRKIGEYAPRTVYCEVVINGDYKGLYLLQEKIKVNDNRVDIKKIEPTDNSLPDLSGGYITKADKVAGNDVSAWSVPTNVNFIHEFPKPANITAEQNLYIQTQFFKLASTSASGNSSFSNGYPAVIDVPSFIDFMIINELAANVDAYQFSTYFHKDKNGKLRAGPLWDLNLTYGNDLFMFGFNRSKTDQWQFSNGDNVGPIFWKDLFDNAQYKCYLSKRWMELTQDAAPLNLVSLKTFINETVVTISEAVARENTRWGTVGNHTSRIDEIFLFLEKRIVWMTDHIGSSSECNNVPTPPLVITSIMYHPQVTTEFPDGNDQEFIEITNNGNASIDLTGVYFGGTGFVYQFPAGSSLQPQGVLQLANHKETFKLQYGFSPFGEFTRSLNSDGQKLRLLDGFGNLIDEVEYSNTAPWPDANANGKYIQLTDVNLDNNVGTNWVASTDALFTNVTASEEDNSVALEIYPNPVEDKINVTTSSPRATLQLHDLQGRLLETIQIDRNSTTFSMNHYATGVYLLHVATQGKTVVRKVIKR